MKKSLSALILSVSLCLGLAVPAWASEGNLNTVTAAAYCDVLTMQYEEVSVLYTDLLDMDGNGSPELLVISEVWDAPGTVNMSVWQMKNNTAVRTSTADCDPTKDGRMGLIQRGKQIYAYAGTRSGGVGASYFDHFIIGANGVSRTYSHGFQWPEPNEEFYAVDPYFSQTANGQETAMTEDAYYQALSAYGMEKSDENNDVRVPSDFTEFAVCGINEVGYPLHVWRMQTADDTYSDVLLQLQFAAKENAGNTPATGSYKPFTITGLETFDFSADDMITYEVSFEQALVQQAKITVLSQSDAEDLLETKQATLLYVKKGSPITITTSRSNGRPVESIMTYSSFYGTIENGRYTESFSGTVGGDIIYSGAAEKSFRPGTFLHLGNYYIQLGDDSNVIATVGGFSDVKEGAYYADAVAWAIKNGITTGTSATTFSPDATCTTGQIITFLWRANGSPTVSGVTPFSDVSPSDYFYQASLWAKEQGLLSGAVFRGDTLCTRAATVTYLWKLAGQPSAGTSSFTDVPASASYAQAVAWAVNKGITSGTGDQKFSPDAICTRGQVMTFIYRDVAG